MPRYRRCRISGGCYFFTVVTANRSPLLLEHIDSLRLAFRYVRGRHPFELQAAVILPDHLHCIWQLPAGDSDFSTRWALIKGCFSRRIRPGTKTATGSGLHELRRYERGERNIWQPRFWEHAIRGDEDYSAHFDYIHYNPVKHGYVSLPKRWPYSTFRRYVAAGVYSEGWGSVDPVGDDGVTWGEVEQAL